MIKAAISPTYNATIPGWVGRHPGQDLETAAFLSGAALAMLDMVLSDPAGTLPAKLQRQRLALRASKACLQIEGRVASEMEIRDAFYLARAGDALGPVGEMYLRWRKMGVIALKRRNWIEQLQDSVPESFAEDLPDWVESAMRQGSPVAQAAYIIGLVLAAEHREETSALICGDVVLARALGWAFPVPLMALYIKRRELTASSDELTVCCHRAVARAAQDAVRLAADLSRRAALLRNLAPKLRAKASDAAVSVFLSEDAVSPSAMLSPRIKGTSVKMTDRAARRLCDRLVDLGAVRELTGRGTFRLYGVA